MSADRPDRPGVAALVAELDVRRHARTSLVVGVLFALLVFVFFAYLPGTDESLVFWVGLTFVLAFSVSALVATVLVGLAAYRRTLAVNDIDTGRRSPSTLAIVFGLLGWVLTPVGAAIAFDRTVVGLEVPVALVTGFFVVLTVSGIGLKVVGALSLSHVWRPKQAIAGAVAYTALVAAPAVGCPGGRTCLGTPDELVSAAVAADFGVVAPSYAAVAVGGGLLVGIGLGRRSASPPHGFFAGGVAAMSVLPVVAATSADPEVVRTTALYLPVVLGSVGAVGTAVVFAVDGRSGDSVDPNRDDQSSG